MKVDALFQQQYICRSQKEKQFSSKVYTQVKIGKKKLAFRKRKKKKMLDYRKGVHLVEDYYKTTFTGLLEVSRKKKKEKRNATNEQVSIAIGKSALFQQFFFPSIQCFHKTPAITTALLFLQYLQNPRL